LGYFDDVNVYEDHVSQKNTRLNPKLFDKLLKNTQNIDERHQFDHISAF